MGKKKKNKKEHKKSFGKFGVDMIQSDTWIIEKSKLLTPYLQAPDHGLS